MTDGDLVRAGRTMPGMTASTDQRMVEEFMAGADVAAIAARYAVPEEYVDRVIEETHLNKRPKRSWSLALAGNRFALAFAIAWAAWLLLQTPALQMPPSAGLFFCLLVGVVAYALMTARFRPRP